MGLTLCYTALSPFCRKVRMAMEHKGLSFALAPSDHVTQTSAFNPRAEVPILVDNGFVVCNSPDILGYLDRRFPDRLLYPADARAYAEVREWERIADTTLDLIATVIANWRFANLPQMPQGVIEAARHDIAQIYDGLQASLTGQEYVCGGVSAADFALYPQVVSSHVLSMPMDPTRHAAVRNWIKRMRARPEGQTDLAAAEEWRVNKDKQTVDTEQINWGTFRLEWLMANGHAA
jgi:glutathione S-transferase